MRLGNTAILNSLAAIAEFISRNIMLLILTPFLVHGLGNSVYGIWKILERLITYLYVADGRPTQGLQWMIASRQGSGHSDENRIAVRHAIAVWMGFIPIVLFLGGMLAWFVPAWIDATSDHYMQIRIATIVLVMGFLCIGLGSIAISVLVGVNLGYKRVWATLTVVILTGLLMALSLRYEYGLIGIASANAAGSLAGALLFMWIVRINVAWFPGIVPLFRGAARFLRLNIWFACWTLINKVILNSDIVILGMILTLSAVTEYSITSFAAQTLVTIIALIVGASVPGMGNMVSNGDDRRVIETRRELLDYVWFACAIGGSLIIAWNNAFITLWVGHEIYAGRLVDALILVFSIQIAMIRSDAFIIDLTLDIKRKVFIGAISAVLSVTLAFALVPEYGLVGLCIAMIIGRLPMTFLFTKIVHKRFRIDNSIYDVARRFIGALIWIILLYVISNQMDASTWISFLSACLLTVTFGIPSCFFLMFGASDRARMLARIRSFKTLPEYNHSNWR
ncbi:MAG: polysaccharide biosynthesis C-terminal domain-containing protein [Gammaproteobacteria bacterium]|nr:polysaccharide biosynthesis C-terminal domain-containing protein [Gammaproteobacteria bacterium]